MNLKDYVDATEPKVTQGAMDRLKDLLSEWSTYDKERTSIVETEMKEYNSRQLYTKWDKRCAICIFRKNEATNFNFTYETPFTTSNRPFFTPC